MKIVALNREEASDYRPTGDSEVCISVTDPGTRRAALSADFDYILRLSFVDLDWYYWANLEKRGKEPPEDIQPMTDDQAAEVAEFIQEHTDADALVVHCEAGVSRSVGIARAAEEIIRGLTPRKSFEKHFIGNEYVRRKVLRAAGHDVPHPESQPLSRRFREEETA